MIINENKSVFEGVVRSVRPAADGFGSEITFAVSKNITPEPATDFIRAKEGDVLEVFSSKPSGLIPAKSFVITTCLNAGPGKSRIVVKSARGSG